MSGILASATTLDPLKADFGHVPADRLRRAIAFAATFYYALCMKDVRPRDRYGRLLPRGSRDELAHAEKPEEVVNSAREACRRGMMLFDERRFFEAHEFFEYVWKADDVDDQDRWFWKGVTQVAVGCCHAQRGNDRGALALLERAVEHLRDYPSPHSDIDTGALVSVARSVADQVQQQGASANLDFPKFPTAQ